MATRYYYGLYNDYGANMVGEDGLPIATVYVFGSKSARDKWVDDDVFDNNWHRSAADSKTAVRLMRRECDYVTFDPQLDGTATKTVVEAYLKYRRESDGYGRCDEDMR